MTQAFNKLDSNFAPSRCEEGLQWFDVRDMGVEGRGFGETSHDYDRFPPKARGVVRDPVWELSQCSAGMLVRFVSDATSIAARWSLRFESLSMHHMPSTGVSGLDLYARTEQGPWSWLGVGWPEQQQNNQMALTTAELSPGRREFMLYLPLYNGIERVEIGIPENAVLAPAPPWPGNDARPICFYGTSIVQGGCASRPGMAHPAIVSRRLDRPHLNLGFSGNALCEIEVAQLLAELDPAAYVLDPLPNMEADLVAERAEPFVQTLREARPDTPIVLVEHVEYQQSVFVPTRFARHTGSSRALREAYERLIRQDGHGLHYVEGGQLLGADNEATVDGTHPNDLGFSRIADTLTPVIAALG